MNTWVNCSSGKIEEKPQRCREEKTIFFFGITQSFIDTFIFPDDIRVIKIKTGKMQHFTCPPNVHKLCCKHIGLQNLVLPESLKHLQCSNNHIHVLVLPKNLEYLDCSYNQLMTLDIPEDIRYVYASYNNIHTIGIIPDPETKSYRELLIISLKLEYNNIELLDIHLNKHMEYLGIEGNPIRGIKHWDFIFSYYNGESFLDMLIGGDVLQTLDPHNDITEDRLQTLYARIQNKELYIDWKSC